MLPLIALNFADVAILISPSQQTADMRGMHSKRVNLYSFVNRYQC